MGCVEACERKRDTIIFNHMKTLGIYHGKIEIQTIYLFENTLTLALWAKCESSLATIRLEIKKIQLNECGEGTGIIRMSGI